MCLIFIGLKVHPQYKFILAANRDEFYNRKTAPAQWWEDHPDVLGGRDLEASGTWLALTRYGKISMITNYRDPKNINPNAPSRGQLVSDYLFKEQSPSAYIKDVARMGSLYNGFNLLVGDANELFYYSNYGKDITELQSGLFGLSNHLLETPWPKVVSGKEKVQRLLTENNVSVHTLFDLLYDDKLAPDDKLPDTGVGLERERVLSSMFIKSPGYGTRCSTVILIDQHNRVSFHERVFNLSNFAYQEHAFNFTLDRG